MNHKSLFKAQFKTEFEGIKVTAPGRINLIGEHTDYNGGLVFPAAINRNISLWMQPNDLKQVRVHALQFEEHIEIATQDIHTAKRKLPDWMQYVIGAYDLSSLNNGVDIIIDGNIPVGAGLSSSAALSCGLLMGFEELANKPYTRMEIALKAQRIEHEYVGVQCGIMDQMACVMGNENQAFLLNCESMEWDYAPIEQEEWQWALIDSKVSHSLKDSAYNKLRAACESTLLKIKTKAPNLDHFNRIYSHQLADFEELLTDLEHRCARHVLTENERAKDFYNALLNGNMQKAGALLNESHQSLKNDYEVSCEETDFLVDELCKHADVAGARQMGGGFGGCVLFLVKRASHGQIVQQVVAAYSGKYTAPNPIDIRLSDGCRISN